MAREQYTPKIKKKEVSRHFPAGVGSVAARQPEEPAQAVPMEPFFITGVSDAPIADSPQTSQPKSTTGIRQTVRTCWSRHKRLCLAVLVIIVGGLTLLVNRQLAVICASERECFFQAYQTTCQGEPFSKQAVSEEGSPIFLQANLKRVGSDCQVAVSVDASQDMFAPEPNQNYVCTFLALNNHNASQLEMQALNCTGSQTVELILL